MKTIKTILSPLASLRVTVVLLAATILVVFAGTLAQRTEGIWQVQHAYFHSWFAWVPLQNLLPFVGKTVPGGFWFLGGYSLAAALLINLLSAHTVRFKFNWKRSGIILIHLGIILLLVGELISSVYQVESQIMLADGQSTRWSQEGKGEHELAIVDSSPPDHDDVVVISDKFLRKNVDKPIQDKRLPFDVTLVKYYGNSARLGPMQQGGETLANAGHDQNLRIVDIPQVTANQTEEADRPAAFVKLSREGKDLGTYVVSVYKSDTLNGGTLPLDPQKIEVAGRTFELSLRPKRIYRPYTITLLKFAHDVYPRTDTPRNFSSLVRLVDPEKNVDREVLIRMNEPLRYRGETFYQQKMGVLFSTIQVVNNPAWMMPYFACAIGALGLVIHFGMTLVNFLRKRMASPLAAPPASASSYNGKNGASGRHLAKGSGGNGRSAAIAEGRSYTLAPSRGLGTLSLLVGGVAMTVCVLVVGAMAIPKPYKIASGMNLEGFANLPVLVKGRVMPVDSLARASLKIVSQKESFVDGEDKSRPAVQWLADVMSGNRRARGYKVFRVDHPQIKGMFNLTPENGPKDAQGNSKYSPGDKLFAINEIFPSEDNFNKLREQAIRASNISPKLQDPFDRKIMELWTHVVLFMRVSRAADLAVLFDEMTHLEDQIRPLASKLQSGDFGNLNEEENERVARFQRVMQEINSATEYFTQVEGKNDDFMYGVPQTPDGQWAALGESLRAYTHTHDLPGPVRSWLLMLSALREDNVDQFNQELARYQLTVDTASRTANIAAGKAGFETFYNRFDPFTVSMVLYIMAFVLVCASWLGWQKPLWSATFAVTIVAVLLHTFGIAARMYISERPPVTNLYSSSLLIGWAVVLFCVGLEVIYRRGIGFAVASAISMVTVLIAGGLAMDDAFARGQGDTMAPLQAVLDTNLWLSTHVVCVVLGYAATFLAGVLGIAFVVAGVTTTALQGNTRKELSRMIYAIVCFAMFFSFVGTILGGIWADQSWGRFWGWDSKENGAVLVVIWNAIILHARWGGMVRERGIAVLAIAGNIVTSWSWFGTNMLGVGLHSYGFMEAAATWLAIADLTFVALMIVGMLPLSLWKSYGATTTAAAPPRLPGKALPV